MKKLLFCMIFVLVAFACFATAQLQITFDKTSVQKGETIQITVDGNNYYRYLYIYDSNNKAQKTFSLCDKTKCSGSHTVSYSVPSTFPTSTATVKVYDYSKVNRKRVGWISAKFNIGTVPSCEWTVLPSDIGLVKGWSETKEIGSVIISNGNCYLSFSLSHNLAAGRIIFDSEAFSLDP